MKCVTVFSILFIVFYFIGLVPYTYTTCVLESYDNFIMDCAYKKSGLFRVRNLGGIKTHFSLGISVGDDFGFRKLLEELGGYRRRSLNVGTETNVIGGRAAPGLPNAQHIQQNRQVNLPEKQHVSGRMNTSPNLSVIQSLKSPLQTIVPAFKPLRHENTKIQSTPHTSVNSVRRRDFDIQKSIGFQINLEEPNKMHPRNRQIQPINQGINPMTKYATGPAHNSNTKPVVTKTNPIINQKRASERIQSDPTLVPQSVKLPVIDLKGHTIEELAAVANVSVSIMQAAIKTRQQQILAQQKTVAYQKIIATIKSTTITTPTMTTTQKPKSQYKVAGSKKVMNAPKEYYPGGYMKNFDDNFTSKVDLPKTSFQCTNQKHFPGLYSDEDLGCMVFHVCAFTDDGLIMKSFLCPEGTLFDQTILKCNWWYYVDCTSSRNLYNSNIPVSKSYQLMKALTYFSKYKTNAEDGANTKIENNSADQSNIKQSSVQRIVKKKYN